jgi:hypothetical protein
VHYNIERLGQVWVFTKFIYMTRNIIIILRLDKEDVNHHHYGFDCQT